ncbi:putative ABC transporter ATP-binding protein (plasmid) [Acidiphilium multivorum AIU301]|uniref:Putative ABC transporter ATP-binding protein n=1 Tax=Acidiphilium multivorum (strain DSM 11245 / JCM 8867 / NBRC 100883 / AIU 301) TaxID=926570 RepID=F0J7U4_ACIMA|nr:oligopeptide/dipeptide ABC transporter ATP-binding protein [Acidiphilium multivorum]BAJ83161.1 putative ABC transporter ATP-binding protein [Acidiphilium multivorum AIU301]GAN72945.1 ABC transporter [Acidiphilium multivorum AIU301]
MTTPDGVVLLEASGVSKRFAVGRRVIGAARRMVHAVDGVSLCVVRGETLGIVGESGCGKSTLGRCLMRLHDVSEGSVVFDGINITHRSRNALRPIRRRMQMVFQDPAASLNPRYRVRDLIAEPMRIHATVPEREIGDRVARLLDLVGLRRGHMDRFPHEFSGGQRQRIGIARAIALEPDLIVADEPVSALDVSVQAQVVNLFQDLQERLGLTYVFIAHDLSIVRQITDRVAVMYLGSIVETGPTDLVFTSPSHPYTMALISAVPMPDPDPARRPRRIILTGDVPNPISPPSGCRFHPRCPRAQERCRAERPALRALDDGRDCACHFPET